jgi:aspartyl-tRNA(Asn)/glutamyl-tRNA(Gln) amidotransferase subunit A
MFLSIKDIRLALSKGTTVVEIVQTYLEDIEKRAHLNAFVEVFASEAITHAQQVQQKLAQGNAGKLAGVVLGIKDNLCYQGHKVTASSKILSNFESLFTATSINRLLAEDAIIIGRLNCDEFAMGSSNEKSCYGPVLNNHDHGYVPGGSSGGGAVAVSAGLCTAALGSDTGGSIRQPASWTGTYGLKPSYGRISRAGLLAYASSFDQIGTFTNDLDDAILLYEIMAGQDPLDATTSSLPVEPFKESDRPLTLGVLSEYVNHDGIDPVIKEKLDHLLLKLKEAGVQVKTLTFPYMDFIVPAYYVLTTAEASSNLSRYDGVHFGYRAPEAQGVDETYLQSRTIGFGEEVKRRIITGTFVLSNEYYDTYYTKAQKVRTLLQEKTKAFFEAVDCLILPTTPTAAFKLGEVKDPIQMYLQDIFTVHANLTGNPAMSIPFGKNAQNLPFGLQLMSKQFDEKTLFSTAKWLNTYVK